MKSASTRTITWNRNRRQPAERCYPCPLPIFCPNPDCSYAERTGEPAEYREGVTQCSDCGSTLVAARPESQPLAYEEFVPVFEITNAALVPFVESLLTSAAIRYFIKGERVQDFFGWGRLAVGFSLIAGPPVVYVEPDHADEARELLADVSAAPEDDGQGPVDEDAESSS